jgi:hypothetical protein
MRAFVIALLLAAAPIYLGQMLVGGMPAFNAGSFTGGNRAHIETSARDFAHDAVDSARSYAMSHPDIIEGLKAHHAELQEFRSHICSVVKC